MVAWHTHSTVPQLHAHTHTHTHTVAGLTADTAQADHSITIQGPLHANGRATACCQEIMHAVTTVLWWRVICRAGAGRCVRFAAHTHT
jgi:hypothetical protein